MSKKAAYNNDFLVSEELCQNILELSSDGIFVVDSQAVVIEVNPRLSDMLGYRRDDLLGLPLGTIISDEYWDPLPLPQDALQKVKKQQGLCNLSCRDGTLLMAELQVKNLANGYLLGVVHDAYGRTQLGEQFRESEERFRLLTESSLTGIYLIQDGKFRYVNRALADMFGYTVEEIINNLNMVDVIYPEDRPLVIENIRRREENEKEFMRYVFRGLRSDDSIIYVEVHGGRIQYRGKPGVIGTLIDVTVAKETEAALRISEERYRTLYNKNPSMFFTIDSEGIITAINAFCAKKLGYTKEELQNRSFFSLCHDEDRVDVTKRFNTCLQFPGQVYHWQFRKIRKDGMLMWGDEFVRSIEGPDGDVYVLVVCQDITDSKELEKSLKVSQHIFDKASLGIFVIGDQGDIIDVNEYACLSLGYIKEELCRLTLFDIAPSYNRELFIENRGKLKTKQSIMIEALHQRKNGEVFPVQVFINNLPYSSEELSVCFVHDISEMEQARIEQKDLEAQLKQVQKLESIGRLAGGIAHDLNNLLTPIIGYGELLSLDTTVHNKAKEKLAHMSKAAIGARDLVKQLLAFSRKQVFECRPLNINQIVDDFFNLIRRTLRENVKISIRKSAEMKRIAADQGQIEQVLMNLVVNASDAMPDGGKLSIETKMVELDDNYAATHLGVTPGNYVMMSISDSGDGMDEDTLSKIFEPFFSTKGELGTGLGLSTVYGIIKQHNGSIWVYSEQGIGTTFKIYLPVTELDVELDIPKRELKPIRSATETILLVEDNETVLVTVYDILLECGYTVITAPDGRSGLEKVASGTSIDMLLTDMVMPDMTGKELASLLSAQIPLLKVLYMSGYTDEIIVELGALEEGVQFIQKPFTSLAILKKVRAILDS